MRAPRCVKEVRAFLGLAGFYRRFIPKFAKLAKPLFVLLQQDKRWEWGLQEERGFNALKAALAHTEWLASPTAGGKYRVYTDFSSDAMGAALH